MKGIKKFESDMLAVLLGCTSSIKEGWMDKRLDLWVDPIEIRRGKWEVRVLIPSNMIGSRAWAERVGGAVKAEFEKHE